MWALLPLPSLLARLKGGMTSPACPLPRREQPLRSSLPGPPVLLPSDTHGHTKKGARPATGLCRAVLAVFWLWLEHLHTLHSGLYTPPHLTQRPPSPRVRG